MASDGEAVLYNVNHSLLVIKPHGAIVLLSLSPMRVNRFRITHPDCWFAKKNKKKKATSVSVAPK